MPEESTKHPSDSFIRFARILEGYKVFKDPAEENNNSTFRGQIETTENEIRNVIIKALPSKELANEIVANIIGLTAKLDVPEFYLAESSPNHHEFSNAAVFDGQYLLFCSCDVAAPSVATLFQTDESVDKTALRVVAERLARHDMANLYEFDEWTANVDRHHANMLLGGSKLWLIDHGNCFTGPRWKRDKLDPSVRYRNKLEKWVTPYLNEEEVSDAVSKVGKLQKLALGWDLRKTIMNDILLDLLEAEDVEKLTMFLEQRIPLMRDFAIQAFGRLT